MFVDQYPKFLPGRILKGSALELLRDFPRDQAEIIYGAHGDGVIAGCGIEVVDSSHLAVRPGIIRHQGRIYTLREAETLEYRASGQDSIVKVRFGRDTENGDLRQRCGDIVCIGGLNRTAQEIELCRFRLKPGARLRDEYQNFEDMATEYDTVNIVNVPFAASDEATLPPAVTTRFAAEAIAALPPHPFDYAFIAQCAQGAPVARRFITAYTSARLGIDGRLAENKDMHRHLARILADIRLGKDLAAAKGRGAMRRILVD